MKEVRTLGLDESIPGLDGKSFGQFWQWAYSDILSNGNRSVFAEYIVGAALGVVDRPRREWHRTDLLYSGKEIEVKASAYVQAWAQKGPSSIKYDVAKKIGWDYLTNTSLPEPVRSADCYVFCLHPEKDPDLCEISNVKRWEFYIFSKRHIERAFGNQKTVGLSRIRHETDPVDFAGLRTRVDQVLAT
jgi:hypothetical protein